MADRCGRWEAVRPFPPPATSKWDVSEVGRVPAPEGDFIDLRFRVPAAR